MDGGFKATPNHKVDTPRKHTLVHLTLNTTLMYKMKINLFWRRLETSKVCFSNKSSEKWAHFSSIRWASYGSRRSFLMASRDKATWALLLSTGGSPSLLCVFIAQLFFLSHIIVGRAKKSCITSVPL